MAGCYTEEGIRYSLDFLSRDERITVPSLASHLQWLCLHAPFTFANYDRVQTGQMPPAASQPSLQIVQMSVPLRECEWDVELIWPE